MITTHLPTIRKAKIITGRSLTFRDATTEDAAFILSLRTDEQKSRFLSATSPDIAAQRTWLKCYAKANDQAYFIIQCDREAIGTVRLYDAQNYSFCWGSWILQEGAPVQAAMESALVVYAYAVDHLGFRACHFDVRKNNERVCKFHERFGARRTAETDLDYYYALDIKAIQDSRRRYSRFLPGHVIVSW